MIKRWKNRECWFSVILVYNKIYKLIGIYQNRIDATDSEFILYPDCYVIMWKRIKIKKSWLTQKSVSSLSLNNEILLPFRCHERLQPSKSPVITGFFRPLKLFPLLSTKPILNDFVLKIWFYLIQNDMYYPHSIRYFDFCYQMAIT